MPENESRLTVYFEDPFWVGVYERVCDGALEAAKITFGAEPKDHEVYAFLEKNWRKLRFSPPVAHQGAAVHIRNPKRLQRSIQAQLNRAGGSTKSQQALQLQREAGKLQRKERSRQEKEAEKARRFAQCQEKRKDKRRGH